MLSGRPIRYERLPLNPWEAFRSIEEELSRVFGEFSEVSSGYPPRNIWYNENGAYALASRFADEMLGEGIYVIGFSYPVVPKGEARIRVQISAAHSTGDIEQALSAFRRVGRSLGVIP